MRRGADRLSSARLTLRRPYRDDAAAIFARYAGDPEVTRWVGWPRHESLAATAAFLEFSASHWDTWPAGPYLIEARSDGRLLGSTGFNFVAPESAETGYVLARDAWGQGYATEALAALLQQAPAIGIRHVFAECHHQHHASQRVLEKNGFRRNDAAPVRVFPNLGGGPQHVFSYSKSIADQ